MAQAPLVRPDNLATIADLYRRKVERLAEAHQPIERAKQPKQSGR